ncbi:SDR family oxidoreductase [Trinickia mobilis]|uniref:SDR family oxidoreductase n=1 Tax=Trinickia mobilis TaxID=2816356 RepID=UPI001A8DBC28|nr:SDR family oxidoreductase [Trinickia mobilis]
MRLKDKVAIVTGAGAGIGAATARALASEGAKVVLVDLDGKAASAVADELPAAIAFQADVTQSDAIATMVRHTQKAFDRIDVLVNNAGRGMLGTVVTTAEDDWNSIIGLNVNSVFLCSKHVIPVMQKQGGGAIINVSSTIATVGIADRASYVASKGAVSALTRAMALDHAADNIRVNSVAPGVIWTNYYDKMLEQSSNKEGFLTALKARSPLNRMGTPAEIAFMIAWLASDEASFATGAEFTIDGGYTAR